VESTNRQRQTHTAQAVHVYHVRFQNSHHTAKVFLRAHQSTLAGGYTAIMHWIYFDVETERAAHEVGGWHHIDRLGLAVGVTLSSRGEEDWGVFRAAQAQQLGLRLREADCVVGFNLRGFDFRVLQPYVDFDVSALPHFDLMLDLKERLGFRPSLNSCCEATLGTAKSADGLQSLQWWREGRHDEVIEYCKQDVLLTRRLHEWGAREKSIRVCDRNGRPRTIAVDWRLDQMETPAQMSLF
jgi:hypothetical protein